MVTRGKRGPYVKGQQRREAILAAALEAYAESDAGGPTLKAIATRAGIPESSLLHYFGTREELFVAVVAARDEADRLSRDASEPSDAVDLGALRKIVVHNAQTPGLVKLFAEQSVAAASSGHPAHEYFRQRYPRYVDTLSRSLCDRGLDEETARWFARVLIAAADGLQVQWLLDPTVDMDADLQRLAAAILGPARADQ